MARENIRTLRKQKNLSQRALAKAAGLTGSELSRIECGYRDLSASEASALARALGVAVQEVAGKPSGTVATTAPVPGAQASPAAHAPALPLASTLKTDLTDPANFRELPDMELLNRGELELEAFRSRLRDAVDRATKILHTSKVPADVWRAWREFERRAHEALRTSASGQAAPVAVSELDLNNSEVLLLAERAFQTGRKSKEKHREKSFNALFFESAQGVLPGDVARKLVEDAELRSRADRSMGFVRHFRLVAQQKLSSSELHAVIRAVQKREARRKAGSRNTPANPDLN